MTGWCEWFSFLPFFSFFLFLFFFSASTFAFFFSIFFLTLFKIVRFSVSLETNCVSCCDLKGLEWWTVDGR